MLRSSCWTPGSSGVTTCTDQKRKVGCSVRASPDTSATWPPVGGTAARLQSGTAWRQEPEAWFARATRPRLHRLFSCLGAEAGGQLDVLGRFAVAVLEGLEVEQEHACTLDGGRCGVIDTRSRVRGARTGERLAEVHIPVTATRTSPSSRSILAPETCSCPLRIAALRSR